MKPKLSLVLATVFVLASNSEAIDYETHVFPIFKEKCAKCHLDDDKGSVRLNLEHIKGEFKFTVKPGNPVGSSLYDSVTTKERDIMMPPPGKGTPLTEREKKMVHDWIAEGAKVDPNDAGQPSEPAEPAGPEPVLGKWENSEGQVITATLLRVEGPNVIFKLQDGREVPYPMAKLSPDSQAKAREFSGAGG